MKEKNPIRDKSYGFALLIIRFYSELVKRREYVLSKQLLKSGTSIGANIHEAVRAQSRNDFIAKMSIAHKEAEETQYWLHLLQESGIASNSETTILLENSEEIIRMLTSILKTTKSHS